MLRKPVTKRMLPAEFARLHKQPAADNAAACQAVRISKMELNFDGLGWHDGRNGQPKAAFRLPTLQSIDGPNTKPAYGDKRDEIGCDISAACCTT